MRNSMDMRKRECGTHAIHWRQISIAGMWKAFLP